MRATRSGFSLLEVILALVMLGGAVAVLGEIGRLAMKNAAETRDLTRAQTLCESKVAEIVSGITPPSAVSNSPFDSSLEPAVANDPTWVYSIDSLSPGNLEPGLIAIRVTVTKNQAAAQHPVSFSLVRWLPDPNVVAEETSSSSGTSGTSSSSGTGGSNGSSH